MLNVALLEKIRDHILAEPNGFYMQDWECGTTCCIGGWAVKLSGQEWNRRTTEPENLLGLSNWKQELSLFYTTNWPKKYEKAYDNAKTPKGRARAGANYINYFIKENACLT